MDELSLEVTPILPEENDCPHCVVRLQEALRAQKGITGVEVKESGPRARLSLRYDPLLITPQQVEEEARRAGLELTEHYGHLTLPVSGLDCADCARTLEEGVARLPGVLHAAVALLSGTLSVEYDRQALSREQIEARARELGYGVAVPEVAWRYRIEGMDCADCAVKVEKGVAGVQGVHHVHLNFASAEMEVHADDDPAVRQAVEARVRGLGYAAILEKGVAKPREFRAGGVIAFIRSNRPAWWALGAGFFLLLGAIFSAAGLPPVVRDAAYAASIVVGGIPVARSGWAALVTAHSLDINVLMTIAATGAMVIGQWAEGATTIFLFAIGELLERYTMDRARGAIRALMDLSPQQAIRVVDGGEETVPVEALRVGDQVRVRAGERIPVDGEVQEGRSAVDQAAITGESVPVEKGPGDPVYAGTLNGEALLRVQVTRPAQDSTLARIISMVEEAQTRKAPAQRFLDRFARVYTPAVVAGAVLISTLPPLLFGAPFATWFSRALVLLVIACPCALVLSTPVSVASAISTAARIGVLVKGGAYLEALGQMKALAMDKTGTLTAGRPQVTQIAPFNGHSADDIMRVAAAIEGGSTHPLAQALLHEARRRGLTPPPAEELQILSGRGATAVLDGQRFYAGNCTFFESWSTLPDVVTNEVDRLEAGGQTAILVGTQEEVWGIIGLADRLRPQSPAVVEELHRIGVQHIVMLTGDNQSTAKAVAIEAGVDDVRADLLPGQKVDAMEMLLLRYGQVGMVGDGVNDAPVLARATVGVAMGAIGSDVALETADVALMTDDLERLPEAVRLGRRTRSIITQNIAIALGLKAIFLGLAVAGIATLWMAVFADVGASLIVTTNGMRLLLRGRS